MRLLDKRDVRKVLIEFKEEGKVRIRKFLSNRGFLKAIDHIPSNLKLNLGGKLVKTILSKCEEGVFSF